MGESQHRLGAPWSEADRADFEASIIRRHGASDGEATERAVDYAYKVIDRQINKARGLLTYNALIFAAFRAVRQEGATPPIAVTIGGIAALASCFPLLLMMYVAWGTQSAWRTNDADFRSACTIIYRRSYLLTSAIVISSVATLIAVLEVLNSDKLLALWQ